MVGILDTHNIVDNRTMQEKSPRTIKVRKMYDKKNGRDDRDTQGISFKGEKGRH